MKIGKTNNRKIVSMLIIIVIAFAFNTNMVFATTSITVSTPTNLKVESTGYNSTKLTWGSVSGASGYQVYRATSSLGTYSCIKTTPYISYTNTGLTTGKTYYYKIRAYKMLGTKKVYGKYSTIINTKAIPATPTSLQGTPVSNTSNKVSWKAVSGASGYQVYRATSIKGTYNCIKTTTLTTYTNTGLASGTSYYYKVRAYRTVGTTRVYSKFTTVVTVVTDGFNSSTASKNIAGEFTDTGNGIIAILANNNSSPISLSATAVFYDETGAMIGKSTDDNYYFEAGRQCSLYFYGPTDDNYNRISYSSYKIIYSVESIGSYIKSNVSDIKMVSNVGTDNVMVEVTNDGSNTSDFTQIGIVFFKNGEAIAYDYHYAECGTPGSVDYLEFSFPYDENYDKIQIDNYKIFVNSSYGYTW